MTQTLPLSIVTNRSGLLLGYTVLNLDRTEYASFALATESAVAGTYYADGGYEAPDAGGYLVVSESDGGNPAVLTALAEEDIDPKVMEINSVTGTVTADVISLDGQTDPLDNLVLSLGAGGLVEKLNSMLEVAGLAYRFTAEALAEGPTGGTALTAQEVADAVSKLAPTAGTPAAGSVGAELDAIIANMVTLGSGAITFTYTLESSVDSAPIADADVWVTTDITGTNVIAVGRTNAVGQVVFYLDAGTVYVWRQKTGWTFSNPDTEVVA